MGLIIKVEMRKVNGLRMARFTPLSMVEPDSIEELQIISAVKECGIAEHDPGGVFRIISRTMSGESTPHIGGIDVPVDTIQQFTHALGQRGFEVT